MDDAPFRDRARGRFGRRCGYCGVHEDDAGATLTLDHHRPRARGGETVDDNLVYACGRCNEHKGAYWHERDLPHIPLLHPGRDNLGAHLREDDDGRIVGLTGEGRFFVDRLRLNRPQLVAYRGARAERERLRDALDAAVERARALEKRINDLNEAIDKVTDEIDRG